MFPVNFNKDKTAYLLDCLDGGKSIEGIESFDDVAALAGACFTFLVSHGPVLRRAAAKLADQMEDGDAEQHPEHAEADSNLVMSDVHAAIEWYGQMGFLILDDRYDEDFEPKHTAAVYRAEEGRNVVPVSGFKGAEERTD